MRKENSCGEAVRKYLPAIPEKLARPAEDAVGVRLKPDPLSNRIRTSRVPSGVNLLTALRWVCREEGVSFSLLRHAFVSVNGIPVPWERWASFLVMEGDMVSCSIPMMGGGGGGGGKNPLRSVLQLVVVAVAAAATWYIGGAGALAAGGWFAAGSMSAAMLGAAAAGAIMMGGMLLVNAIAPASTPKLSLGNSDGESAASIWSIDGSNNKADPYGAVPVVLGQVRFAPRFASGYYTFLSGNDQYVRYLYCVAGNCEVSSPRIGDTDLFSYQGADWRVHRGWTGGGLVWFGHAVSTESTSITLTNAVGWQTRTTAYDSYSAVVYLTFPQGLKKIKNNGDTETVHVDFDFRYRAYGTSAWTGCGRSIGVRGQSYTGLKRSGYAYVDGSGNLGFGDSIPSGRYGVVHVSFGYGNPEVTKLNGFTGTATVSEREEGDGEYSYSVYSLNVSSGTITLPTATFSGKTITAQRRAVTINFPSAGKYEVSFRRITGDASKDNKDESVYDEATVVAIQSWRSKPAIVYQGTPLTVIEVQLRATEQLSGSVDEFNCLFKSYFRYYNGTSWVTGTSSNPSALGQFIATGSCSTHAAKESELDLASWGGFHRWCERMGWRYNGVVTSSETAGEVLHNVLAAGRGSYAVLDGHGVVWDDPDALVEEVVTPRNSWGFESSTQLNIYNPQALRMRFLNERMDYQEDERTVYMDGYDINNTTEVLEFEQDGVTDPDLIWKHGRLRLADLRLRPAVYTFSMEAEALTLVRGSRFRCVHDVTFWGIGSGRIVSLKYNPEDETRIVGIELDEYLVMEAGKTYGVRIQTYTKADAYYSVVTDPGESRELTFNSATGIPASAVGSPAVGNLVAFGRTDSIGTVLMVQSITPGENLSAQITAVDAAPNVYDALTGNIPEWDSRITFPTRYSRNCPEAPRVTSVISDESVLLLVGTTYITRILVNYEEPTNVAVIGTILYWRTERDEAWHTMVDSDRLGYFYIENAEDGETYMFKLASQNETGTLGAFSETVTHVCQGKTAPPPDITGFTATISNPEGIVLEWERCPAVDLSYYWVRGDYEVRSVDTRALAKVFEKTGELTFTCVAVDTSDSESVNPATASVTVERPLTPEAELRYIRSGGSEIAWPSCFTTWDIAYYTVEDVYLGETFEVSDPSYMITPRPLSVGVDEDGLPVPYTFHITATDIFRNQSITATFYATLGVMTPPEPTAYVDGTQIVVEWELTYAPFEIDYYEVWYVDESEYGEEIMLAVEKVKGNSVRFEAPLTTDIYVGFTKAYTYRVRAVDVIGDESTWGECTIEIGAPGKPQPEAVRDGGQIRLSWTKPSSALPIIGYEVWRQWDYVRPDGIVETREESYGMFDAQAIYLPPVSEGTHYFYVRAVDNSGNSSMPGECNIFVNTPLAPTFYNCSAVDNNIMLYWTEPDQSSTFPIEYYVLYTVEDAEVQYSYERGRVDSLFCALTEVETGLFTYGIRSVDVAGNMSSMSLISVNVSQLPDYIFYFDYDSVFNGSRTNIILDGVGGMLGPVPKNETWEQNIVRAVEVIDREDVTEDTLTWTLKDASGMEYFVSPIGFEESGETAGISDISKLEKRTLDLDAGPGLGMYYVVGNLSGINSTEDLMLLTGEELSFEEIPDGYGLVSSRDGSLNLSALRAYEAVDTHRNGEVMVAPESASEETTELVEWARYTEILDVNVFVASTNITVIPTYEVLSGNPVIHYRIETSADMMEWAVAAEDSFVAFGMDFQYVRLTMTWKDGIIRVTNIKFTLDVKNLNDNGECMVYARDCYEDWDEDTQTGTVLKPAETLGTQIKFSQGFVDVMNLMIECVDKSTGLNPMKLFRDEPYPEGFRAAVFDKNGTPVDTQIKWTARGV